MRRIKQVIGGLGSLTHHAHDANAIVEKASRELAQQMPALDFVNSHGWVLVQQKYRAIVSEMKHRIVFLAANAEKNEEEIQHTSDLIAACELMLDLTNKVIKAHQEALRTININQQGIAGGNTAR